MKRISGATPLRLNIDMESAIGIMRFAPFVPAKGAMFSARKRAGVTGQPSLPEAVTETEFYSR